MKRNHLEWISVAIAALAVALSQVAPVATWFTHPELSLSKQEVFHFYQSPFRVGIEKNTQITNLGARAANISHIRLSLYRDDESDPVLKMNSWGVEDQGKLRRLNAFTLGAESSWSGRLLYLPEYKRLQLGAFGYDLQEWVANPDNADQYHEIVNSFKWAFQMLDAGTYRIKEEVLNIQGEVLADIEHVGQVQDSVKTLMERNLEQFATQLPDLDITQLRKVNSPVLIYPYSQTD